MMSFVLFAAEYLTGRDQQALVALKVVERHVKAAAEAESSSWQYSDIERSLQRNTS
jgi:hypothetical protein